MDDLFDVDNGRRERLREAGWKVATFWREGPRGKKVPAGYLFTDPAGRPRSQTEAYAWLEAQEKAG
jgi:hypothetical protein